MMQKSYKTSSFVFRHTCSLMQHFPGTHCKPIRDPWSLYWKQLNLLLVTLSVGLPPTVGTRLHAKPKKWYFYCYCFIITPPTAKANGVCSCVSSAMARRRSRRPTEPTRTRWVRLRVGLRTHTHMHTQVFLLAPSLSSPSLFSPCYFSPPCLFSLFITRSSLSEPLKLQAGFTGVPLWSPW